MAYKPTDMMQSAQAQQVEVIKGSTVDEVAAFIHEKAQYTAVLVYTSPERAASLKAGLCFAETVDLNADDASLRQLNVRANASHHRVLIADKPEVMRGFDYRGGFKGITLLIDRGFESQREAEQALARVGRQGEPALRFCSEHVQLVEP